MNSEAQGNPKSESDDRRAAGAAPPIRAIQPTEDAPLQIEPDDEDEHPGYGWAWNQGVPRTSHPPDDADDNAPGEGTSLTSDNGADDASHETVADDGAAAPERAGMGCEAGDMSDMLRWALDSIHEPALAAADWLARDISPDHGSATALLTDPGITLAQVKQAKSVFKTMRIVGEKSADRRVGARMYAGAIAAGLVRHKEFITSQSSEALRRAFQGLLDDKRMPGPLRDLAGMALCALADGKGHQARRPSRRATPGPHNGQPGSPSASATSMMSMPAPTDPIPMPRSMPRPQPRRKRA